MKVTQPHIFHSSLILKAKLDFTPDITYIMSDYATQFGSKSGMDYSVEVSGGWDSEMVCDTGATA